MGFLFPWQEKCMSGLTMLPSQLTHAPAPAQRWVQKYCCDAKRVGQILPPKYSWHACKVRSGWHRARVGTPQPPAADLACYYAKFCFCESGWSQTVITPHMAADSRPWKRTFFHSTDASTEELAYAAARLLHWGNSITFHVDNQVRESKLTPQSRKTPCKYLLKKCLQIYTRYKK